MFSSGLKATLYFLSLTLMSTQALAQQSVIPGAAGYGIDTPAGRGGQIFRVTNLNDSGSGSLRECAQADGPRVCIFETSGAIQLQTNLVVSSPNLTIAGQTAPQPGILVRGGALYIRASDVLVQHIAIRPGDDPNGPDPQSLDSIAIGGSSPVRNVVIDHCSLSWAIDENLNVFNDSSDITISNSIIAQPLHDSLHPKGTHGFGALFAPKGTEGKVAMIGNLIAHSYSRNPRSRATDFALVNNVIYNYAVAGLMLYNQTNRPSRSSIVGNVFIDGTNTNASPIRLVGSSDGDGGNSMISGSRVYLSDNVAPGMGSDQWSIVLNQSEVSENEVRSDTRQAWPSGLAALPTSGDTAYESVLDSAGSRPLNRDSADSRIVATVRNRGGEIVNCVEDDGSTRCDKNAGGWPQMAEVTRTLAVPGDPNGDSDGDGYTNLEEWLHGMAADLEGGSGGNSTPPDQIPLPPVFEN